MRRHATAISTRPPAGWGARSAFGILCLCGLGLFALFAGRSTAGAAEACPNEAIRQQQGIQHLDGCRAFEMVSPLDKGNGDISVLSSNWTNAPGDALYYESYTAFAGAEAGGRSNQYIAWRTPSGWSSEALNPVQTPETLAPVLPNEGYWAFSSDLRKGAMMTQHDPSDRSGSISADGKALYLRTKGEGFTRLSPTPASPPIFSYPAYVGGSTALDRIFFQSEESLTPDAPPEGTQEAYEWHEGDVSVVGVLPNDEIAPTGATVGRGPGTLNVSQAVSADGSHVIFTSGSPPQLYLRSGGSTKLISASQRSGEEGDPAPQGATFMGSASDGGALATVFFASPSLLTEDAEGDPNNEAGNELYSYDVADEELTLLTPRSFGEDPQVRTGWLTASADGSVVYFIAKGKLTADAPGNALSFYVSHNGALRYLNAGEVPSMTTRVSANGDRLVVRSYVSPTGAGSNGEFQLYLYDYPSDAWRCVSCNEVGATTGKANFTYEGLGYGGLRREEIRNLSADGSRLYFETSQPLVPEDANGVFDVYQWEDGNYTLISTGEGRYPFHLLNVTADASSVFIGTRERLVPQDRDTFIDAYAARVGGGFLYQPPAPPCSGDSCQRPPAGAVPWSAAGSSSLRGPGNRKPKHNKCSKAKKKKSGKPKSRARCQQGKSRQGGKRASRSTTTRGGR